jgi:hypothetical protein
MPWCSCSDKKARYARERITAVTGVRSWPRPPDAQRDPAGVWNGWSCFVHFRRASLAVVAAHVRFAEQHEGSARA